MKSPSSARIPGHIARVWICNACGSTRYTNTKIKYVVYDIFRQPWQADGMAAQTEFISKMISPLQGDRQQPMGLAAFNLSPARTHTSSCTFHSMIIIIYHQSLKRFTWNFHFVLPIFLCTVRPLFLPFSWHICAGECNARASSTPSRALGHNFRCS